MHRNSLGHLVGLLLMFALCAAAQANFSGSDDFDDNSVDGAKWGTDFVVSATVAHGVLSEANQRLEFTNDEGADTGVLRPWILNSGSYVEDWEVRTDVHLGQIDLPVISGGTHLDVGLYVYKSGEICSGTQVPSTFYWITLDQWRNGDGEGSSRSFETNEFLDCTEVGVRADHDTTGEDASLRITFDSAAKRLTAWYDENGSADGYQWVVLDTISIDSQGNDWGMTDDSTFGVMLGCSTGAGAEPEPGQAYCDNFYAGSCTELLWPLEVGEVRQYSRTDVTGASWDVTLDVLETVVFHSNTYYHLLESNYRPGEVEHMYFRLTASTIYTWDVEGATETIGFRLGRAGEMWVIGDEQAEILGTESVTVPYGGPYNAIVFRMKDIAEDSPYWFEYIVPGLGLVKEVDYWTDDPPRIMSLVSILAATETPTPTETPSTPIPTPTPTATPVPMDLRADVNEDGCVDFEDLIIIMKNWHRCEYE